MQNYSESGWRTSIHIVLCTCVLLANSPFPWKSGKQMRLGKWVSTPQWAVRFCSIHTVVREHLTMRAYKSQEALRSNNRLMLSLKHVTLNLNIVCPHVSTFQASYMSAEQSPPPHTHTHHHTWNTWKTPVLWSYLTCGILSTGEWRGLCYQWKGRDDHLRGEGRESTWQSS